MRNVETGILPRELQLIAPVVSSPPSETTIHCVISDGYQLRGHNQGSTPYNICLDCFPNLPAWRSQIYKENHYLQFSRGTPDYRCQSCNIVIEKTRSPYSCKSCRDTLKRTINQFKTSKYDWSKFPSVARIISEFGV